MKISQGNNTKSLLKAVSERLRDISVDRQKMIWQKNKIGHLCTNCRKPTQLKLDQTKIIRNQKHKN